MYSSLNAQVTITATKLSHSLSQSEGFEVLRHLEISSE